MKTLRGTEAQYEARARVSEPPELKKIFPDHNSEFTEVCSKHVRTRIINKLMHVMENSSMHKISSYLWVCQPMSITPWYWLHVLFFVKTHTHTHFPLPFQKSKNWPPVCGTRLLPCRESDLSGLRAVESPLGQRSVDGALFSTWVSVGVLSYKERTATLTYRYGQKSAFPFRFFNENSVCISLLALW